MSKRKKGVKAPHFKDLQPGRIVLSPEDFDRFVEELNNPRPPNAKLKKAMEKFKALKAQQKRESK